MILKSFGLKQSIEWFFSKTFYEMVIRSKVRYQRENIQFWDELENGNEKKIRRIETKYESHASSSAKTVIVVRKNEWDLSSNDRFLRKNAIVCKYLSLYRRKQTEK